MSRMCGGDYNVLEVFVEGRVKSPEESIVSPVVAYKIRKPTKTKSLPNANSAPWTKLALRNTTFTLRDTAERCDASASADGNMIC